MIVITKTNKSYVKVLWLYFETNLKDKIKNCFYYNDIIGRKSIKRRKRRLREEKT